MIKRPFLCTLGLLCLVLAGCQQTRWPADPEFGVAVRKAAAAQYVNPDAPIGNPPLPGLDGPSAAASVEVYQKSFKNPSSDSLGSVSSQ